MSPANRLSGLDSCFLYLETPTQPLNVIGVMELDTTTMPGGYSYDRLRRRLAERIRATPELRQRLSGRLLNLGHPAWVVDGAFDVSRHVRRLAVPVPGGARELAELCAYVAALPMDRDRPLWEMWVLEGVNGSAATERVVLLLKMHHSSADGVSYMDVFSRLCSDEADPPAPDFVGAEGEARALRIAAGGLAQWAYRPVRLVTTVLPMTGRALRDARRRAVHGRAMAAPFSAPPTVLNARLTAEREVAFATLDLDAVRVVTDRYGVTVNDVVTALAGGAVRQLLREHGGLPTQSLVAMTPVSVHTPERSARNQLSGMLVQLQTHIADPVERLRAVAGATALAKEQVAANSDQLVEEWFNLGGRVGSALGGRLYTRITRSRPMYNVVVSNVPGPRRPTYLLGARLLSLYALGPVLTGAGLNITVCTVEDRLHVGLIACPEAVVDLWGVAEGFAAGVQELLASAA